MNATPKTIDGIDQHDQIVRHDQELVIFGGTSYMTQAFEDEGLWYVDAIKVNGRWHDAGNGPFACLGDLLSVKLNADKDADARRMVDICASELAMDRLAA